MMGNSAGAKAPSGCNALFAELKRCTAQELRWCFTDKLNAAVESHVSRKMRDMGHPTIQSLDALVESHQIGRAHV